MGLLDVLKSVVDFITTTIDMLGYMVSLVFDLFSTFFNSMPSFISMGLGFVFSLGMIILVIRLVRKG